MLSSFDRPRYVKTAEKEEEPPKAVTDEEVPAASEHREEASVSSATATPMDVDGREVPLGGDGADKETDALSEHRYAASISPSLRSIKPGIFDFSSSHSPSATLTRVSRRQESKSISSGLTRSPTPTVELGDPGQPKSDKKINATLEKTQLLRAHLSTLSDKASALQRHQSVPGPSGDDATSVPGSSRDSAQSAPEPLGDDIQPPADLSSRVGAIIGVLCGTVDAVIELLEMVEEQQQSWEDVQAAQRKIEDLAAEVDHMASATDTLLGDYYVYARNVREAQKRSEMLAGDVDQLHTGVANNLPPFVAMLRDQVLDHVKQCVGEVASAYKDLAFSIRPDGKLPRWAIDELVRRLSVPAEWAPKKASTSEYRQLVYDVRSLTDRFNELDLYVYKKLKDPPSPIPQTPPVPPTHSEAVPKRSRSEQPAVSTTPRSLSTPILDPLALSVAAPLQLLCVSATAGTTTPEQSPRPPANVLLDQVSIELGEVKRRLDVMGSHIGTPITIDSPMARSTDTLTALADRLTHLEEEKDRQQEAFQKAQATAIREAVQQEREEFMMLAKTRELNAVKATVKSILDELGLRDVVSERLRERPDVLDRFGWIAEAPSNISCNSPSVELSRAPNEGGDDANTVGNAGGCVFTATHFHSYAVIFPNQLATLSRPKCTVSTSNWQ